MTGLREGFKYPMGMVMDIIYFSIKYSKVMKIKDVPVLVGDPGIGKSESLKALAKLLNMNYLIISVGALAYDAWNGGPELVKQLFAENYSLNSLDNEEKEATVLKWSMSDFVRQINSMSEQSIAQGKNGLLVILDDFHLMDPLIQKYMFELLQNKSLNGFRLHQDAHLIGAMNGKDSAGAEQFLSPVLNRMALYSVSFDMDHWYKIIGAGLEPSIASFAKANRDSDFFSGGNATDEASPSPRSWTELSKFLKKFLDVKKYYTLNSEDKKKVNNQIEAIVYARVGHKATKEFMKHFYIFSEFNFENILKQKEHKYEVSDDMVKSLMFGYIIRYVENVEDIKTILYILKNNFDNMSFQNSLFSELSVLYAEAYEVNKSKRSEKQKAFITFIDELTGEIKKPMFFAGDLKDMKENVVKEALTLLFDATY